MSTAVHPTRTTPCGTPCAGLCTPQGFASAYREHRPRLLARARGLLDDPQLAEDVVQEVLTRAWTACSSFDPAAGPPVSAWLATITRRVVIDQARARAVRPGLHPAAADDRAADRVTPDAADTVVTRVDLLEALSGMTTAHRAVLVGAVVRDRPHADLAAELHVPVGTVKSRVHHALRGMRTHLTAPGPGTVPAYRRTR
ncbi:sigma-70 family RNA polymerase sigma factor [Pseudonocardia sp. 73-21]|jgi:RNA polymerase sigma-70 factor (ECF subfamily)|uniref:RNA polymerase sigma factor n=1 Tax=Pseudonocardia sp. 73-21 TaxID=1895809 RepID=UPI0009685A74|nr:sigma-70 family RNA polymerase sigma factor [Pseudonocardia sp. 73-21]OJY49971.1 MAG: hypothetical protein BGP03_24020 [Pseudonocardia sp. 73-21]